jgi:heme/copper-type cytochrome/quinol oxidase subunit 2
MRRRVLLASENALLLVAMMFLGSLVLWVGVPVGWLWIGSQLEPVSSLATAVGTMMIGMLLTIAGLVTFLAYLNRRHVELQEARGAYRSETTALELVLVASAAFAVIGFAVWFFGFSGSSPIPFQIGY